MALNPGEQPSGGWVIDADGRQSISIQGGTGGGGGGGGGTPLSEGDQSGALPAKTLWIAAANGAVLQGLQADASGRLRTVVEGSVAVANFPATQAVSGTVGVSNFPATQPVSGTVTANVGTGTQPVSGTIALDATSLTALETISVANFPATQPVSGSVGVTGALPAGANNIGDVDVASLPALPAGTNQIGTTLGPALTKGTQGATGYTTQDLKDAGRQQVMVAWIEAAGTANAESAALANFAFGVRGAASLTAASQYTVSAGKTLRIEEVHCYLKSTSTVLNLGSFRIRQAAAVAVSSPVIWNGQVGISAATTAANAMNTVSFPIPDGLEVAAGQQISFTWATTANSCTVGLTLIGFEY